MYVATQLDKSWLRSEQRKLYARSWDESGYVWRKLWGLVTDRRNLRLALARVASNRGARTSGVDGQTVRKVLRQGVDEVVEQLRAELRSGSYRPSPVRRVLIPKPGQRGNGWRKPGRRALRWRDGDIAPFEVARIRVGPFRLGWMRPPGFVTHVEGKPGA
jgi:hypothetical protein